MAYTYLQLTNKLLRAFNEVEIPSESSFNTVIGIQALAKDAVKDAVKKINHFEYEWPFNAYEHTQVLQPGVVEYAWPDNFKVAEWESFFIQKDDALNVNTKPLKFMNREEWYRYHRDQDYDAGLNGVRSPDFVFPSHGIGFGVSPSPDKAYTLRYRYFTKPNEITNATDTTLVPDEWDHVIIAIASVEIHKFRSNAELAAMQEKMAMDQLDSMRNVLINKEYRMYEGRVNNNRFRFTGGYVSAR